MKYKRKKVKSNRKFLSFVFFCLSAQFTLMSATPFVHQKAEKKQQNTARRFAFYLYFIQHPSFFCTCVFTTTTTVFLGETLEEQILTTNKTKVVHFFISLITTCKQQVRASDKQKRLCFCSEHDEEICLTLHVLYFKELVISMKC